MSKIMNEHEDMHAISPTNENPALCNIQSFKVLTISQKGKDTKGALIFEINTNVTEKYSAILLIEIENSQL